jgi:hypothetical protein
LASQSEQKRRPVEKDRAPCFVRGLYPFNNFKLILRRKSARVRGQRAQIDYEKSKERQLRIANNQLTEERDALSASVQSVQSQLKVLEAGATSPLALVPLARQFLELARKSAGLPFARTQG